VYINKNSPPPEPPDTDASEEEILAFDKKNHWVGQVLEVKAANTSEVWLRVFWLYWPEELPRGRQKHHGNQELIMSNHMEIVDAKTVTSRADINHWDEKDEDQDVGHRFWRQFYDVQLKDTKSRGLSEIRRHCVCQEYYNPDRTMLKCPSPKCGIWNHQECLEQAVLERTYARRIDDGSSVKATVKPFPASKMAQLQTKIPRGQKSKGPAAKFGSFKNLTKQFAPWKGLLKAEVTVGDKGAGGAAVRITDERSQDPEVWTEGIQCLNCGTSID
jgi:BAH domain